MDLTDDEKRKVQALVAKGEPLPDKYRWKLFANLVRPNSKLDRSLGQGQAHLLRLAPEIFSFFLFPKFSGRELRPAITTF